MNASQSPPICASNAALPQEPLQPNETSEKQRKKTSKKPVTVQSKNTKRRRNRLKQPLTKDMPRVLSELLNEPKIALLHRVVKIVGPKIAWQLLRETLRLEKDGGQSVDAAASGKPELFFVLDNVSLDYKVRRRTAGGVFFTLLKEKVSKEMYRTIYEVEDRKKKEAKKRARSRQRQKMDKTLATLRFDDLTLAARSENFGVAQACGAATADADVSAMAEDGEVVEYMQVN